MKKNIACDTVLKDDWQEEMAKATKKISPELQFRLVKLALARFPTGERC